LAGLCLSAIGNSKERSELELLTGKEAATRVQGIIVPKYQVHGHSVDLTVRDLYAIDPTGKVDFGGGEYEAAGRAAVGTIRRHPEDRYSWWEVTRGSYFIEFNETLELALDEAALLEPHERLLRAGASHVAVFLRGYVAPLQTLLYVNALHLEIKQNARVSRLLVFRLKGASEHSEAPSLPGEHKAKAARSKAKHR
jgi:deoxycytidine triphosphate deaminase